MEKPDSQTTKLAKVSTNEKEFAKKNKTVEIVSAAWKGLAGMPDHPQFWTHMLVKLKDGSRYLLSEKFVKKHDFNWVGRKDG